MDNEEYEYDMMEKYNPVDIDNNFRKEVERKTQLAWQPVYLIDSKNSASTGESFMIYPETLQSEDSMPAYYSLGSFGLNNSFKTSPGNISTI